MLQSETFIKGEIESNYPNFAKLFIFYCFRLVDLDEERNETDAKFNQLDILNMLMEQILVTKIK